MTVWARGLWLAAPDELDPSALATPLCSSPQVNCLHRHMEVGQTGKGKKKKDAAGREKSVSEIPPAVVGAKEARVNHRFIKTKAPARGVLRRDTVKIDIDNDAKTTPQSKLCMLPV